MYWMMHYGVAMPTTIAATSAATTNLLIAGVIGVAVIAYAITRAMKDEPSNPATSRKSA